MFDSHVNSKIFLLGGMLLGGIALQQLSLAQESELQERGVEAKSFRAVKVASAPVLDGKLDDEVWQQAERITDFHQSRPGDHAEPSEETELYVVYTEDALYVAARMYDSNPELISAPTIRHGQGLPFDDRLVIILDPFNQGRAGYRFETNLNGVRHDSLYETPTSFRLDWNTIWETATSIDGKSWVAEVEIPFKSSMVYTSFLRYSRTSLSALAIMST